MKKLLRFGCMLLCCLVYAMNVSAGSSNPPSKEKTVSDVENRTVYAIVMHNPDFAYNYGISTFKTGTPRDITLLHQWGNNMAIFAGAAAHGEYYGYFYQFESVGGALPVALSKINLRTGEIRDVKDWSDVPMKFQDMTYDYSTNTMYAVGFDQGVSSLYMVDLETGDITKGPQFKTNTGGQTLATLAATYDGRLYGLNPSGVLFQIDKETGNLTRILDTGIGLYSMQSMEFDHTDEALYWATNVNGSSSDVVDELYKIDVEKKTIKSLGQLGGEGTTAVGLYIPYVLAGFDAPGEVTEMKVIPASEGKEEAIINWKNPTKTHGGDDFTGTMTITLERDGEIISSSIGEAGAEMSWTDKTVKQGEHVYTIKSANNIGEGVGVSVDTYVGKDIPGLVEDLKATVGNECKSIKLTWTIPEKGFHGGYYDKSSVKFKIVRYPDEVVLEDDFTGISYEDNSMKRLGAYYYGITATNEAGSNKEYRYKNNVIAGNALEIPYTCDFENQTIAMNQWSVVNANNDEAIWYINSGFGQMFFGDATVAVEYMANPQVSELDADEWLITPPLNFEADKDYYISFDTRSYGEDEFNVTFGELNTPESQNQMIKAGVFTTTFEEVEGGFQHHQFQLPKVGGIHCAAIHLVTPFGESGMFQLNNMEIGIGKVSGIESVITEKAIAVHLRDNYLEIDGEFKTANIYDATGTCIISLTQTDSKITTVGWQPGIYIVKVANVETVYTQKVIIK